MAEKKQLNFFQKNWKKISKWFREMKSELKKVVWPSRRQIINNTLVVLTVMLIAAVVIWGIDFVSNRVAELLISFGG